MRRVLVPAACALAAFPAWAQNEAALKRYFEGKSVTVKVDMPASHQGIDLRFDKDPPFNSGENASRIRNYDVAIREGARARVTSIKLKDDMIEFHLDGGGFNWGSEKTTKSYEYTSKTSREEDLDNEIKHETDQKRKRRLEEERDELRRIRERRDSLMKLEIDEYNRIAHQNDQDKALRSGSRFNLRFKKQVPPAALTPEGVMDYMTRWLDFPSGGPAPVAEPARLAGPSLDWMRKGLKREDVERQLGRSRRDKDCPGGDPGLQCVIAVYPNGPDDVETTYVEGLLVKWSVRRR
jgi:hypothetical protein